MKWWIVDNIVPSLNKLLIKGIKFLNRTKDNSLAYTLYDLANDYNTRPGEWE